MGPKDWSPFVSTYLVVSGNLEDSLEDSSLVMVGAADMKEVDSQVDQAMGMGADVFFIFKRTEPAAIWDSENERKVQRPSWRLVRAF